MHELFSIMNCDSRRLRFPEAEPAITAAMLKVFENFNIPNCLCGSPTRNPGVQWYLA
jgi:hypothetical protein